MIHATDKSLILPYHFYSKEAEKKKLNWFCFEYALELQMFIGKRLKGKLEKVGVNAQFCIHYSKHMKKEILRKLSGKIKNVNITYHEIEKFFPWIGDKLVDDLLSIASKAWDSQTGTCVCLCGYLEQPCYHYCYLQ